MEQQHRRKSEGGAAPPTKAGPRKISSAQMKTMKKWREVVGVHRIVVPYLVSPTHSYSQLDEAQGLIVATPWKTTRE